MTKFERVARLPLGGDDRSPHTAVARRKRPALLNGAENSKLQLKMNNSDQLRRKGRSSRAGENTGSKKRLIQEFDQATRSPISPWLWGGGGGGGGGGASAAVPLPIQLLPAKPVISLLRPDPMGAQEEEQKSNTKKRKKKKKRKQNPTEKQPEDHNHHHHHHQQQQQQQSLQRPRSAFAPSDHSPIRHQGGVHRSKVSVGTIMMRRSASSPPPRRPSTGQVKKKQRASPARAKVQDQDDEHGHDDEGGDGPVATEEEDFHGLSVEQKLDKLIPMRETCLAKLKDLVERSGFNLRGDDRGELLQLLLLTRRMSLHIVSMLDFWRKKHQEKSPSAGPFPWHERNAGSSSSYLLKMCADTEFLAQVPYLEEELGVRLESNPFFGPLLVDGTNAVEALAHHQHQQPVWRRRDHHHHHYEEEDCCHRVRVGDPLVGLVDPLMNNVDVRTNLRIQRACRVLYRELRRSTEPLKPLQRWQVLDHRGGRTPVVTNKGNNRHISSRLLLEGNPNYPPTPAATETVPKQQQQQSHAHRGHQHRSGGGASGSPRRQQQQQHRGHIMQFFSGEQEGEEEEDDAFSIARLLGSLGPTPGGGHDGGHQPPLYFAPQAMDLSQPHRHHKSGTRGKKDKLPPPPSPTLSNIQSLCDEALGSAPPSSADLSLLASHPPASPLAAAPPTPVATTLPIYHPDRSDHGHLFTSVAGSQPQDSGSPRSTPPPVEQRPSSRASSPPCSPLLSSQHDQAAASPAWHHHHDTEAPSPLHVSRAATPPPMVRPASRSGSKSPPRSLAAAINSNKGWEPSPTAMAVEDEEELEVFTLATINTQLDDTLEYMRRLQHQHDERRRALLLPTFQTWRRAARILGRIRYKASSGRHDLVSAALQAWKRRAFCSKRRLEVERMHEVRVSDKAFTTWLTMFESNTAKRSAIHTWVRFRAREVAVKKADGYVYRRHLAMAGSVLHFMSHYARARRAYRAAAHHYAARLQNGKVLELTRRWRGVIRHQAGCKRASCYRQAMMKARSRAAIARMSIRAGWWRRRRLAKAHNTSRLLHQGARRFVKWKQRTARKVLVALAGQAHRRRSCRRALAILRKHLRIANFIRLRQLDSRRPTTLQAKHLLRQAFKRWVSWNDLRLTLQLIVLFWQYHGMRASFLKWKQLYGPHPSRFINTMAKTRHTLYKGAGKLALGLGRLLTPRASTGVVRSCGTFSCWSGVGSHDNPMDGSGAPEATTVGCWPTISPGGDEDGSSSGASSYLGKYRRAIMQTRREKRAARVLQKWWAEQRRLSMQERKDQGATGEGGGGACEDDEEGQCSFLTDGDGGASTCSRGSTVSSSKRTVVIGGGSVGGGGASLSDVSDYRDARDEVASLRGGCMMRDRQPSLESLNRAWVARAEAAFSTCSSSGRPADAVGSTDRQAPLTDTSANCRATSPPLENRHDKDGGDDGDDDASQHTLVLVTAVQPSPLVHVVEEMPPAAVKLSVTGTRDTSAAPTAVAAAPSEEAPPLTSINLAPPTALQPNEPAASCITTEVTEADKITSRPSPQREPLALQDGSVAEPDHHHRREQATPTPSAVPPVDGVLTDTETLVSSPSPPRRSVVNHLDEDIEAALCIQAAWRGHHTRRRLPAQRKYGHADRLDAEMAVMMAAEAPGAGGKDKAATDVQRHWKGHRARRAYKEERQQRSSRRRREEDTAATSVQKHWRGHRARASVVEKRRGAPKPALRPSLEVKVGTEEEPADQPQAAAAINIQKHWRGSRARRTSGFRSTIIRVPSTPATSPTSRPAGTIMKSPHGGGRKSPKPAAPSMHHEEQEEETLQAVSGKDQRARQAQSSLFTGIKAGDLESIRMALALGADINGRTDDGETPLIRAVLSTAESIEDLVNLLVLKGAHVDAQDDMGRTALMTCLTFGVDELIPCLLQHKASLRAKDTSRGRTGFHYCVDEENLEACELLALEDEARGQDAVNEADDEGCTPLHFAVRVGNRPALEVLLRHPDIEVNTVDSRGHTPLLTAVLSDRRDLVDLLLQRGAQPCPRGSTSGLSVLFAAIDREDQEVIKMLLQYGHVDAQDGLGNTLLHWAVIKHSVNIVQVLLDAGADVSIRNADGCFVTDLTVAYGFKELEEMISEAGRKSSDEHAWREGRINVEERRESSASNDDGGDRPPRFPKKAAEQEEPEEEEEGFHGQDGFYQAAIEGPPDDSYYYDF